MWTSIVNTVLKIGGGWLERRDGIAKAKAEAEVAVITSKARIEEARATAYIQLAASAQDHEQTWERLAAEQAAHSWKDEWWTILFSLPIIGAFVPGLQPFVVQGFANLEMVPDWYLASVGVAVAFAFGVRKVIPAFTKKKS